MTTSQRADDPPSPSHGPRERIVVNSAQVAAAQLQMSIDRKFGRKTPEIIKKIAAAK